jgi:hypothetical protein
MVVSRPRLLCILLAALLLTSPQAAAAPRKYALPVHGMLPRHSPLPHPVDKRVQLSRVGAHLPCALGLDVLGHLSHGVLQHGNRGAAAAAAAVISVKSLLLATCKRLKIGRGYIDIASCLTCAALQAC